MSAAERDLVDVVAEALASHLGAPLDVDATAESQLAAEDVLRSLSRPHRRETLARWLGDTLGLDVIVQALLDAYGPNSIVRSLVDTGALVEVCGLGWGSAGSMAGWMLTDDPADGYTFATGGLRPLPDGFTQVYRTGGDRG